MCGTYFVRERLCHVFRVFFIFRIRRQAHEKDNYGSLIVSIYNSNTHGAPPPRQYNLLVSTANAADAPVTLGTEEVSAEAAEEDTRLLSPGAVSVIRPDDMKGEQKNLPELLKMIPGLHVVEAKGRGAYTVATIRGSSASQVSLFVDGVLMNLASEDAVDLTTIPIDNVERIEVYRGYIPARFAGASMGGVINIITKKPDKTSGEISVGAGSYGKIKTNLSYSQPLGDGTFFAGANYEASDGDFKYLNDNATEFTPEDDYWTNRQNNSYKNKDILLKWVSDEWQLRFSWKENDRDQPYDAAGYDRPNSKPGATLDTEQTVLSIGRRFQGGDLNWGIKADYLKQNRDFDNPANSVGAFKHYHNEFNTDRFGMAVDASLPLGKNHLLEFMGDYSNERLEITGDRYGFLSPVEKIGQDACNLQLQDTISLNKAGSLWLSPIVRYNYMDGKGEGSWGVALNSKIGETWMLKATYGTYNRPPKLYEQYGDGATIVPNSEKLEWEEGTQYDVGIGYTGKLNDVDLTANLAYFWRKSDNLIELVYYGSTLARYENVGEAEVYGLEFEAKAAWKTWELFVAATWLHAMDVTDGGAFSYRNGYRLPHKPEYEGTVRLSKTLNDEKLTLFAECNFTGANFFDKIETVEMDGYVTANLGFHYRINDSWKISAGVDDVFDKSSEVKRRPVHGVGPESLLWFPLQGRTYYLTVTWTF